MECWNQEFTVTEITNIFKNLAQETFCHIKVRGEISGLSKPKSGHIYFTLKDLESVIYAVCWKTIKLDCSPEDGLEVICSGSITTYQSKYQLSVDQIEICAPGNIAKILLERKAKLELEGIFSQKKTLPFLPKIIGIITSLTGSVINDIINRVKHRFASHLMVWPVSVQGSDAAEDIISAIKGFNKIYINRPDILIIARGGGSVEDLWVFNEEKVVRAVAASKIPIISAIGHENDFTLTDYAADLRAPTPTAAIEMALPTLEELVSKLEFITQKILNHINALIYETENKLSFIDKCISHPKSRIEHESEKLYHVIIKIDFEMKTKLYCLENKIHSLLSIISHYDKARILKHGYAILYNRKNKHIDKIIQLKAGDIISIELNDGIIFAEITKAISKEPKK